MPVSTRRPCSSIKRNARVMAWLCASVFALASAPYSCAQTLTIRGIVVDQNGSPVAGASVALNSTHGIGDVKTNAEGRFDFGEAEVHDFILTVTAEGFGRFER